MPWRKDGRCELWDPETSLVMELLGGEMGERRGRPDLGVGGAAMALEGRSAGPPVLRCQRVCHYRLPAPLSSPLLRVRVRLWESPGGSGRRKQKTFVICVCESRRCHLYVCCHVATVKSSRRRSGLLQDSTDHHECDPTTGSRHPRHSFRVRP